MWQLREETPGDRQPIHDLNCLAFGGADEAELVDHLRAAGDVITSIVAVDDDTVVGHILFSEMTVEGAGRTVRAAALAPMAVHPARQRSGIGSALVRYGLEICRARGVPAVIVLGHENYYPRFGFSAAKAARLLAPFSGPAFMALDLADGVLDDLEGAVRYPPAFGLDELPPGSG